MKLSLMNASLVIKFREINTNTQKASAGSVEKRVPLQLQIYASMSSKKKKKIQLHAQN